MRTPKKLIRNKTVRAKLGDISNPTFWRLRQKGFPEAVLLPGSNVPLWDEAEVDAWIEARDPYRPRDTLKARQKAEETRTAYKRTRRSPTDNSRVPRSKGLR